MTKKSKEPTYQQMLDTLQSDEDKKELLNLELNQLRALSGDKFGDEQHRRVGEILAELRQLKLDYVPRLRALLEREETVEFPRCGREQGAASEALVTARETVRGRFIEIGFLDIDPTLRGSVPHGAVQQHPLVRDANDEESNAFNRTEQMQRRMQARREEIARLARNSTGRRNEPSQAHDGRLDLTSPVFLKGISLWQTVHSCRCASARFERWRTAPSRQTPAHRRI